MNPATLPASAAGASTDGALNTVLAYHERTKHRLERYAPGPETLDWDAQPDPFRRYAGAALEALPLSADTADVTWAQLLCPGAIAPRRFNRSSVGLLLELSFALSAWKQHGPDRWAVRCNPSSGNLHPTETYVLNRGATGLDDGLYHYAPREHALERRCRLAGDIAETQPRLFVAFSSIHWREAWKYGERAFRYCQLDVGHAIGALRYAAALLGWRLRAVPMGSVALARLLGLDRDADFMDAEREEAERLFELVAAPHDDAPPDAVDPRTWTRDVAWHGSANRLDAHPMYRWPVIDAVAHATRTPDAVAAPASDRAAAWHAPQPPLPSPGDALPAAQLLRARRSAQRFERRQAISAAQFQRIAAALHDITRPPQDAWPHAPRVHPVLFLHRVEGYPPGAYLLARHGHAETLLRPALAPGLAWRQAGNPAQLPLFLLAENPALAGTLRTLCCHQALGADAAFAVALLAEFEPELATAPWRYRELFQECGLLGQVLYLEAEAAGLRGTGIGCFFDDASHELLGLADRRFQVLYHFTVGHPIHDERIATEPPYADRAARQEENPSNPNETLP